ncbi:MAG: DUF4962 domain-containing protein [Armatimonadota bacterium]
MEPVIALAMIIGTYSGIGIDTLMDTPTIERVVFYEADVEKLADVASGVEVIEEDGTRLVQTLDGFELVFHVDLPASDVQIEMECRAPDRGSDSYFIDIDGERMEQIITPSTTTLSPATAGFHIPEAGEHEIRLTLRERPGSVIKNLRMVKKDVTPLAPPMREELIGQHPRIYFTEDDIPHMRQRLEDPLVQEFYRLPDDSTKKPPEFRPGQRNGGAFRGLDSHALRYVLKPDEDLREWILQWLEMATTYGDVGVDLDAEYFMEGLALTYDWMYEDIPEDLRNRVRNTIVENCQRLYAASLAGRSGGGQSFQQNHYWYSHLALALGAAAVYGEVPEAEKWLAWAWDRFERIALTFGPDGGFHEGPAYWDFSMPTLYMYVDLYEYCSGEHVPYMDVGLKGQGYFRWHYQLPGFDRYAPLEDSNKTATGCPAHLLIWEASRFGDPVLMGVARLRQPEPSPNNFTFLWLDEEIEPVDPLPRMETAAYYPDIETVFTRTSWEDDATHAVFVSRPMGGHKYAELCDQFGIGGTGHNHPEQNHFFLFGRGATLAGDPGYTYDKQTRNHNTILINGRGQYGDGEMWPHPNPGRAHITHFGTDGTSTIAVGDATSAYPGELGLQLFERTFVVADSDLVVVFDRLGAQAPSTFNWLLHHWGTVEENAGTYTITRNDAQLTLHPLMPTDYTCQQSTYTPQYVHPRRDLTPEEADINLLSLDSPETTETQFLVPMQISAADEAPAELEHISGDGYEAVRAGDVFVAFNTGGGTMTLQTPWDETVTTAAKACVVRNTADGPVVVEAEVVEKEDE